MHSDAEQSIPVSAQYQRTKMTGFGAVNPTKTRFHGERCEIQKINVC